jgi:hypothetical protein
MSPRSWEILELLHMSLLATSDTLASLTRAEREAAIMPGEVREFKRKPHSADAVPEANAVSLELCIWAWKSCRRINRFVEDPAVPTRSPPDIWTSELAAIPTPPQAACMRAGLDAV